MEEVNRQHHRVLGFKHTYVHDSEATEGKADEQRGRQYD